MEQGVALLGIGQGQALVQTRMMEHIVGDDGVRGPQGQLAHTNQLPYFGGPWGRSGGQSPDRLHLCLRQHKHLRLGWLGWLGCPNVCLKRDPVMEGYGTILAS